jgi:hypothetical protein
VKVRLIVASSRTMREHWRGSGRVAAENNIDFAEFNRWAAAHYRDTAAQAILKHLQTGSTRGAWEPLMRQFARRGGGR